MGLIVDTIRWVKNIYLLETTDRVLGGLLPTGISNQQAQELADRTAFLKDYAEQLEDRLKNIYPIGIIIPIGAAGYNSADYDQDPNSQTYGLGLVGTPAEHWALCNGFNGTEDMQGRTGVGLKIGSADYGQAGQQGGAETVTLTNAQMPRHDHTGGYSNTTRFSIINTGNPDTVNSDTDVSQSEPSLTQTRVVTPEGNNQPHENRMPYTTLIYRQRVSN